MRRQISSNILSVFLLMLDMVAQWLKNPELGAAVLRPETCMVGLGCALDIGQDDKAIIVEH